jgi:predicted secreted protein
MKVLLLVAFVALSAACFSSASASKTWTLTEANNNTNITPTLGDTIVIKLKGNPTTGHKWIIECLSGDAVTFPTPRVRFHS